MSMEITRLVEATIPPVYIPPRLVALHGCFSVMFLTENLQLDFERVRSDRRSGDLSAELTVYVGPSGGEEIHSGARLNLSSTQARGTLAKHLETRRKRGDWSELLETAIRLARAEMRRGEPPILLRDAPIEQASYLLDPLVARHGATILFGDGSSAKSLLALAIAVCLERGDGALLGLGPAEPRHVLFLDYEWDKSVHRRRLERLCGPDAPAIAYLRCDTPLHEDVDRVRRVIRDTGCDYLIVDSASWAAGDEPETADSAKQFYAGLRQIGLDALVTAHTTKAGADEKPFGSVFWHNGARLTWHGSAEQESGEDTIRVGVVNRKHNDGRLARPVGWQVDFGERIEFSRIEAASIATVAERMSIAQRIRAELVTGSRTVHELAESLGEETDSVRRTVTREVTRGKLVKFPGEQGIYRIGLASKEKAS
jgi:predicted transcriptional regulator